MRLFIAVNFSDEIKTRILALQEELRSRVLRGSFTRPENLHLTLAFLGETSADRLEDLFRIIERVQSPPFKIRFTRTGCYTHSRKELWWIGMDSKSPELPLLRSINTQLSGSLINESFPVDTRPFNAHITLGREIKHTDPIIMDDPDIAVNVNRISLMESKRVRGLLTYTELFGKKLD